MILPCLIAWLSSPLHRHQDHIIRYLQEENRILKAKLKGKLLELTDTERRRLAVLAHPIDRKQLKDISTIATPDTLQRWYRRLVVQPPNRKPLGKSLGRPRVAVEIEQLATRMATENPRWGYRRIQGALSNPGHHIHNMIVRNILRRNHIDPAPIRSKAGMSWSQFIKLHWEVLEITDFYGSCRSTIAPVIKRYRYLSGPCFWLSIGIRHGAMRVLSRVAQAFRVSWNRRNTGLDRQDLGVFSKLQFKGDSQSPTLCVLSLYLNRRRPQIKAIDQQRSPPKISPLGYRAIEPCSYDWRSMPSLPWVLICNAGIESRRHTFNQSQPLAIQSDSDRVAA